jgi:mannosyltransferase
MAISHTTPEEKTVRLRLAAIAIVAAALRLIFLGARSFWGDEIVSVKLATDNWHGFAYWILRREANMALYYLALRGWTHFGDGEAWVRLLSAVFGIATVAMLYLLGRRLHGERVAWLAALIGATNACLVQFSQEARSYSLVMLLAVLSYYYFLRFIDEQNFWPALMYVVVTAASFYTHFFAALIVCAQIASLLWLPRDKVPWRKLLIIYFAMAVTVFPIVVYVLRNDVGQLYWVQPTTFSEIYKLFIFFAGASKAVAAVLSVISLIACAWAIVGSSAELRRRSEASWKLGLVLAWVVVPLAITVVVSLHKPVFVHRYLLVSLPGYLLLIGLGLSKLRKRVLVAALVIVIALSGVSIVQGYFRPIEDWRGVVEYVLSNAEKGDALLVYVPYGSNNFNFYASRMERKRPHPPVIPIDTSGGTSQIAKLSLPRAWLLLYPSPHVAELAPQFERDLTARYGNQQRREFKGVTVILFSGLKPPSSLPQAASGPRQ